jgi:hypothetical protein
MLEDLSLRRYCTVSMAPTGQGGVFSYRAAVSMTRRKLDKSSLRMIDLSLVVCTPTKKAFVE